MKYIFPGIFLFFLPITLFAQTSFTISGYVKIAESGETLIGATVAAPELQKGTYTNEYGFYSLTLPASNDSVSIRYVFAGYASQNRRILLNADQRIDIGLEVKSLDEVLIEAESFQEQLNSTEMSISRISMAEAKVLPALFGEVDIIKTLQLKPGVSSGSEGSSGIYVRGGGPDQNLILLDNTVLYNPSHLFGFFSTFNSDAVKDVKLYKGGFPAQYGGRLSSVIDVKMNDGNKKEFSGAGGLGLIASRLTLEGPIVKDKASFMISGRRTYVDVFTRLINESQQDNPEFNNIPDYFFYDFNAKLNYEISDKDQLFLSGYFGRDRFKFDDGDFDFNFDWGNSNTTLRWNHIFTPRLFLNTSASYSDYEYMISNEFDIFSFELSSRITDGSLSTDFTWLPSDKHAVKFGAKGIYHRFIVGRLDAGAADSSFQFNAGNNYYGTEMAAYISDDFEVNKKLTINTGFRISGFASDSSFYYGLEPRAAIKYSLSDKVSLKASYARMMQYLHLVSSSGASLPTDIWYPSNSRVKPQSSDQIAAGITIQLGEQWLLSNEVYYKWLHNQIDFRDAANLFVNDNLDREFVFGKGWGYGNEFYLEKKSGKLTGWIGYTLSWAWRQFDGVDESGEVIAEDIINKGQPFHPRNDKRHDVVVVAIYQLNKRWSFSSAWEFRTGNATTLAVGRYFSFGPDFFNGNFNDPNIVPVYVDRNSFRMPAYHKLDVGVVLKFFPKWGESDLTFSVYNAYNRRNPYFIYPDNVRDDNGTIIGQQAKQVALFPAIPSITYNFKF
ncbi:MAG: TonB-dependent receptor [Bacteroidia bacterium]|nr:TonB-dependent receptor [Bacteroidia bacterium]